VNLSLPFPKFIVLEYQDKEWIQTINYEHVPFRCKQCHAHGHLAQVCLVNQLESKEEKYANPKGFIVINRNPKPINEKWAKKQ
jgi:hypothetical protein